MTAAADAAAEAAGEAEAEAVALAAVEGASRCDPSSSPQPAATASARAGANHRLEPDSVVTTSLALDEATLLARWLLRPGARPGRSGAGRLGSGVFGSRRGLLRERERL